MIPKIELRFVRQKEYLNMGADGKEVFSLKKVLQFREWIDEGEFNGVRYTNATEWQTVPFDESVVLEPEGTE